MSVNESRTLLRARSLLVDVNFYKWLTPRDINNLLATCVALRRDTVIASCALRNLVYGSQLASGHRNDITIVPPSLHTRRPPKRAVRLKQSPLLGTASFMVDAPDQRARLLSLVCLMEKELMPMCYRVSFALSREFHAIPFVMPFQLPRDFTREMVHQELEELVPGLGDVFYNEDVLFSLAGVHWENMVTGEGVVEDNTTTSDDNQPHWHEMVCEFCELVKREVVAHQAKTREYWDNRDEKRKELKREFAAEGLSDAKVVEKARKKMNLLDWLYDAVLLQGRSSTVENIINRLCHVEQLPLLQLMANAHTDYKVAEVISVAADSPFDDNYFCTKLLFPLRQFFIRNGFRSVRRVRLPRDRYTEDRDEEEDVNMDDDDGADEDDDANAGGDGVIPDNRAVQANVHELVTGTLSTKKGKCVHVSSKGEVTFVATSSDKCTVFHSTYDYGTAAKKQASKVTKKK